MKINSKDFFYPPISNSNISLIYPWNNWVVDLLALISTVISSGKFREKQISLLQKIFDHKNIFFTNSGRAALTLALKSLYLPKNSEVLLTSFNCPAVIDSIISANATPVFIDINHYGGIAIENAKKALSKKTKAIIVTNIYGLTDDLHSLEKFCRDNNLYLINDLAQTFDNFNSKNKLNKYGDLSIYSFGPKKHLFSLGGGCVMVNNKSLLENVKKLYPKKINNNFNVVNLFLQRCFYYFKFNINRFAPQLIRLNSKKTKNDINKSIFIDISQINTSQLSSLVHKMRTYNKYYVFSQENFDLLRSNLKFKVIYNKNYHISLPLYATIKLSKQERYSLALYLDRHGIASTWNYLPLYYYYAYKKYKVIAKSQSEDMWRKVLSVPFRYPLDKQMIKKIINIINSY